jgi:hypothetical protein
LENHLQIAGNDRGELSRFLSLLGWRSPRNGDGAMTLLKKKVAGLGCVLLGGLAIAHGGSAGHIWEVAVGLLVLMAGATFLVAKVFRRNIAYEAPARRPN